MRRYLARHGQSSLGHGSARSYRTRICAVLYTMYWADGRQQKAGALSRRAHLVVLQVSIVREVLDILPRP
jgi:hypothetical protein